jgi:hypothetical protein
MFKNDIIKYESCGLCFKMIVKSSQIYCKKCQTTICNNKAFNNKGSKSTVYKMRLNKNSKSLTDVINVTRRYIGKNIFNILTH